MADSQQAAPVLSTPDTHILNEIEPVAVRQSSEKLSDKEFEIRYEISRTIEEIRLNKWRRIALQFPDEMLPDSARVFQLLARGLSASQVKAGQNSTTDEAQLQVGAEDDRGKHRVHGASNNNDLAVRLTILADTSYGSCCIDETAAEHVDAEVAVHYGRACLSPTARLLVVHVFTKQDLDHQEVIAAFRETFPNPDARIVITADMPYADHVEPLQRVLEAEGYKNTYAATITPDPSALIPNRTVPASLKDDPSGIGDWELFHISEPPTSLLLTLSSRIKAVHIYPTAETASPGARKTLEASTSLLLRRRYALVTSLATVPIWGILINTLSVKNYLHIVEHVKSKIAEAGKKSYLFVVGKLNAAKVANFSEIGGWVVIGCWETSLIDSKDFYKPVITPFELDLALQRDDERLWTGEWRADFDAVLAQEQNKARGNRSEKTERESESESQDYDSEEESAPPEFDLRTGRYISQTRPMQPRMVNERAIRQASNGVESKAVTRRANGDVVAVNGVASPAAEHLRSKRTWQGLGSDFETKVSEEDEGGAIEEGQTGVARGYTVGESARG